jgi:PhnB protein
MNFYKQCFGGDLELMTYADGPEDACQGDDAQSAKDKIMHACITNGNFVLMASDNPKDAPILGDNISISINCESIPQTQKLFQALSSGGKVIMPLADTFWGAHFGMLKDKYDFNWMLNCPLKS